ncbi:MAG TPA: hypothetical protein VIS96_12160 [Terrimicrobiaceae bacterium]
MEKLLENEKRVERALGNLAGGLAKAQSPADGVVGVLDNLENMFRGPALVGGALAIGVALNKALSDAAKGANEFSANVEKMLAKPAFDATVEDVERMREQLESLQADADNDPLFEKWIFGGQKEQQLESVRQAIEQAAGFVKQAHLRDMGEQLADSLSMLGIAGATASDRKEDAQWISQRLRQAEELQQVIRKGGEQEIIIQRDIFSSVVQRHEFENKALEQQLAKERDKKQLDTDLQELATQHAYQLMGLYSDREKIELQIVHAEEKHALLLGSRAATEKEVNDSLVEQYRLKHELVQLEGKELDSLAAAEKSRLERSVLGKSEIEQQLVLTRMAEQEARGAAELADTAEERQKAEEALTKAAEQRVKLAQMERDEAKKLRDIAYERLQLETADPFEQAQNALARAKREAGITSARADATPSEKAQANLEVLRAQQGLLVAAGGEGPSVEQVAASGMPQIGALRREANRGYLNDAARAQQAMAKREFASALRARDPYGARTRERTDRMTRQADIQALQSQDVLDDTLEAGEAARLRKLSDKDFAQEMNQRRLDKELAARGKEQAAGEPSAKGKDKESVPSDAEAGPTPGKPQDSSSQMLAHLVGIEKNTAAIEKKLPQRALK